MLDPAKLPLFLLASLILLLTPGPAVLYIIARSVDQGRAARPVSVLGSLLPSPMPGENRAACRHRLPYNCLNL